MNDPILICKNLWKSYNSGFPVLKDFNCSLPSGKIIGLLGPNGCGKSTLIKLISGILTPDKGEIIICDEPRSEKTNLLISYLPERTYFSPNMTVDEVIAFFSDFYDDFDANVAREMLKDMNITTYFKFKSLSKGTKEKVQLIMVMARRARLYLLDEPIAGVDPAAREYILGTIVGNYSKDSTIIITTHLISDVEQVLDDYVFLSQNGKILEEGRVDQVRDELGCSLDERFKEVFRYAP